MQHSWTVIQRVADRTVGIMLVVHLLQFACRVPPVACWCQKIFIVFARRRLPCLLVRSTECNISIECLLPRRSVIGHWRKVPLRLLASIEFVRNESALQRWLFSHTEVRPRDRRAVYARAWWERWLCISCILLLNGFAALHLDLQCSIVRTIIEFRVRPLVLHHRHAMKDHRCE